MVQQQNLGRNVSNQEDSQKWRTLLSKIVSDTQERQRIANEVGVSSVTLMRWVNGESHPRPSNMRQLLKSLPDQREAFLKALPEELRQLLSNGLEANEALQEIPSAFYIRVLHDHCSLPQSLHFESLCDLILLQALKQLDPNRVGMEITIAQCMVPTGEKVVRSLRERMGRGTGPWDRELVQKTQFLAAESLAGHVVSTGHYHVIQQREQEQSPFLDHWVSWQESTIAFPIMRASKVAGCLVVASNQPSYFLPARQVLIQCYAELLSIAFEVGEFYDLSHIELGVMPSYLVQQGYIATFRRRVTEMMIQARSAGRSLSLLQAEQEAWQQIEDELLRIPSSTY